VLDLDEGRAVIEQCAERFPKIVYPSSSSAGSQGWRFQSGLVDDHSILMATRSGAFLKQPVVLFSQIKSAAGACQIKSATSHQRVVGAYACNTPASNTA